MRSVVIFPLARGGFILVCFPLHELCRVELVVLGEKRPRGIYIGVPFVKYLEDVSGFLDDGRKIRSGILKYGRIFARNPR